MTDDDLARLLADTFEAHARHAVGDEARPPAPRFADPAATSWVVRPHSRSRILAPWFAAAAVLALVAGVFGLTRVSDPASNPAARPSSQLTVVRIELVREPDSRVGVGMPVVAHFDRRFTDARQLSRATRVTVNGAPAPAAWYFSSPGTDPSHPVEGRLRMKGFWPAHATIAVDVSVRGVSAGRGLAFADNARLTMRTGAAVIGTVDDTVHRLTVVRDGQAVAAFPVSLGAAETPTRSGVKVIMTKGRSICVNGPGFHQCGIKYTQQLTVNGEYLHSAPWNIANIGRRDSSDGCTHLRPSDAKALYSLLRVGDVVRYPNAPGPAMTLSDGYGDWDVPWSTWQRGGTIPTR